MGGGEAKALSRQCAASFGLNDAAFSPLPIPYDLDVFSVFPLAVPPLAVHHRGVHVGWGKRVGFVQQRDDAEQDGPGEQAEEED